MSPRCDAAGARFTEPLVVDLNHPEVKKHLTNQEEKNAYLKEILARAANSSYPVLIHGSDSFAPLQVEGFEIVEKLCDSSESSLKAVTKVYEPMSNYWGQMRKTTDKDIRELLGLLPSTEQGYPTIAHFVRLVTRHSDGLAAANLSRIQASKFFPELHCPRLHNWLSEKGLEPSYWNLDGWSKMRRYLFVQPSGSAMAAHIDGGKSYFFVHVHRGRKLFRLWPLYSRTSPLGLEPLMTGGNEIENWVRAQRMWPASVDPLVRIHACQGFGATSNPCDPWSIGRGGLTP
eukprot:gnl/TRDRNA2_/TRDRNA2_75206_c0_seq1.p1 gnl/TRDRNA2_/TRDRNA2_75206_c0~~gnl/TRDRNA2_/TRDRNA2_75206_c0_seq1.p1  ORF type:complete len:288 (+),score=23.81 gnl/TRDRNA2_/TRDRNA2_75206_c0_seq1:34-897(+)